MLGICAQTMEKHLSLSMHSYPTAKHAYQLTRMCASAFRAPALLVVYVRAHQITLEYVLRVPDELQSAEKPAAVQLDNVHQLREVYLQPPKASCIECAPSSFGDIRWAPSCEIRWMQRYSVLSPR